jgi:nitrogen regulatory protein P-II 2
MMQTVPMKRVTIIGDETVKYRILQEIERLGATGYTECPAHGKGARGIRPRHAEPANVKIEIIATAEVAGRILEHIAEHYLQNYAMIAFLSDVEVLQGEHFGAKTHP